MLDLGIITTEQYDKAGGVATTTLKHIRDAYGLPTVSFDADDFVIDMSHADVHQVLLVLVIVAGSVIASVAKSGFPRDTVLFCRWFSDAIEWFICKALEDMPMECDECGTSHNQSTG